jgi:hypothetical protein
VSDARPPRLSVPDAERSGAPTRVGEGSAGVLPSRGVLPSGRQSQTLTSSE